MEGERRTRLRGIEPCEVAHPFEPVPHGVGVDEQHPGGGFQGGGLFQIRRDGFQQRRARGLQRPVDLAPPVAPCAASSPASARSGSSSAARTGRGASGQAPAARSADRAAWAEMPADRRSSTTGPITSGPGPNSLASARVAVSGSSAPPMITTSRSDCTPVSTVSRARRAGSVHGVGDQRGVLAHVVPVVQRLRGHADHDHQARGAVPAQGRRAGAHARRPARRRASARRRPAPPAARPRRRAARRPARRPARWRRRSRGSSAACPRAAPPAPRRPAAIWPMPSSTTSMVVRTSCTVCRRVTERVSSRGAVPKTSALIAARSWSGCRNHSVKAAMPACATRPTQDRFSGGMSRYQANRSSIRWIATPASEPIAFSRRRTAAARWAGVRSSVGPVVISSFSLTEWDACVHIRDSRPPVRADGHVGAVLSAAACDAAHTDLWT